MFKSYTKIDCIIVFVLLLVLYSHFIFGDYSRFVNFGVVLIFIGITQAEFLSIKLFERQIAMLFLSIMLIVIMHIGDSKTIVSVFGLFLMYFGSVSFSYWLSKNCESVSNSFMRSAIPLLFISFILSTFFTAIGHKEAPSLFIWQQISFGVRAKLMSPDFTGHSSLITLSAMLLIYAISYSRNIYNFFIMAISAVVCLVLSGSRTGLLLVLYLFSVYVPVRFYDSKKIAIAILLSLPFVFIVFTLNPNLTVIVENIANNITNFFGFESIVRIEGDISTGRTDLNTFMIGLIENNPLFGLGNSSDQLEAKISIGGGFGFEGATAESMFRIPVKHGLVYFSILIGLIVTPLFMLNKNTNKKDVIKCLSILCCVVVFLINGGFFENFFGESWIFITLINALIFDLQKSENNRVQI